MGVVGIYVGFATVGVFAAWFCMDSVLGIDISGDKHTTVSFHQLTHWGDCAAGGAGWEGFKGGSFEAGGQTYSYTGTHACDYFGEGKTKASTLSLTVLVAIEMFNALNALSEDGSLVTMPPWSNPYLLLAMVVSFGMHFVILYVDFLADMFNVMPLSWKEWKVVLAFSLPVILIDEVLKFAGRRMSARELEQRLESMNVNGSSASTSKKKNL